MKKILLFGLSLLLVGCNTVPNNYSDEIKTELPTPIYKKRYKVS